MEVDILISQSGCLQLLLRWHLQVFRIEVLKSETREGENYCIGETNLLRVICTDVGESTQHGNNVLLVHHDVEANEFSLKLEVRSGDGCLIDEYRARIFHFNALKLRS